MDMFRSVLETVPKTRSQMVNDLEIPEEVVTVTPYIWSEVEDTLDSESLPSVSVDEAPPGDAETPSSESSLALSRAMTDSEIDYSRYRRYKSRSFSDPWVHMRTALETFSSGYLDSLNSFQDMTSESTEDTHLERQRYNEELKLKMERFFEEECRVFSPDDPGLIVLEEALRNADLKDSEIDSNTS